MLSDTGSFQRQAPQSISVQEVNRSLIHPRSESKWKFRLAPNDEEDNVKPLKEGIKNKHVRCPGTAPTPVWPIQISTIFAAAVRLQEWMDEPSSITSMTERDRQISEIIAEERSRLRNFIRRRVPDPADAEDIVQEVFYELVEANRLLMPIEHVTGWLFRVARNRITDLFRKRRPDSFGDAAVGGEDDDASLRMEDLLPSAEAGPEALYLRHALFDELERALDELPEEQRAVFVAHELEGRGFKEMAAESGVSVNTLLSRKRYAVRRLRERLQDIRDQIENA